MYSQGLKNGQRGPVGDRSDQMSWRQLKQRTCWPSNTQLGVHQATNPSDMTNCMCKMVHTDTAGAGVAYGGKQSVHHLPLQSSHCEGEPAQYSEVSPQYCASQLQHPSGVGTGVGGAGVGAGGVGAGVGAGG